MFEKIIVALDLSDMGKLVFARALSLAKNHGSKLLLLHALSPEEDNSPLPIPPDLTQIYPAVGNDLTLEMWKEQWQAFEKLGLETLARYLKTASEVGVEAETRQSLGNPGKIICKTATEENAQLIVIGHRGRRGLSELFLGSVSNYVMHHADCSVLVVQPTPEQRKEATANKQESPQ